MACTAELARIITDKLAATWSPEQIANTVTKGLASFKSIYRWLYIGLLANASIQNLRQKGKRRKNEKRGKFAIGFLISERPKEVDSRCTFEIAGYSIPAKVADITSARNSSNSLWIFCNNAASRKLAFHL